MQAKDVYVTVTEVITLRDKLLDGCVTEQELFASFLTTGNHMSKGEIFIGCCRMWPPFRLKMCTNGTFFSAYVVIRVAESMEVGLDPSLCGGFYVLSRNILVFAKMFRLIFSQWRYETCCM